MRKNILYSALLATFLLAGACTETDIKYGAGNFVAFTADASTVSEGVTDDKGTADPSDDEVVGGIFSIPVQRTTTSLSQDETITFEVTSSFVSDGSDASAEFEIVGDPTTVTIPAGQATASIVVRAIDNVQQDGNKVIVVRILSTSSNLTIGTPGPDGLYTEFRLTIVDNDCPVLVDAFTGAYSATEIGFPPYDVTHEAVAGVDGDPIRIRVKNFWNFSAFPFAVVVTINDDATVTIEDQQVTNANTGNGVVFGSGAALRIVSTAPGTALSCEGTITVSFRMYNAATNATFDQNTIILRRRE